MAGWLPYEGQHRKQWVDLGKGISMLLVVLFHCEIYLPIVHTGTMEVFSFFREPFFFFLSGYVFVSDYHKFSLSHKLKQIVRGIVWTYLVFTLVIAVPKSLANGTHIIYSLRDIALGYASWFVVALGVAQVIFALFLSRCKRLGLIALYIVGCVMVGLCVMSYTNTTMPFQFEKALIVELFFGLGFFYRIYEPHTEPLFHPLSIVVMVIIYGGLMYMEYHLFQGATANLFWNQGTRNFPLYFIYALTGISVMLLIVKQVNTRYTHLLCYVGVNSLIFYYLNGGATRCWSFIYIFMQSLGLRIPSTLGFAINYLLVCATLIIVSRFIRKYIPILVGEKASFHRLFPFLK